MFGKIMVFLLLGCFFSSLAFGAILFMDDFEQDSIGQEPSKWETATGVGGGEIVEDPAGGGGKVFRAPECDERGGDEYLIGEEDWKDYEVMWDWYFVDAIAEGIGTTNNSSLAFRFQTISRYYLLDTDAGGPRGATTNITWWMNDNGSWLNVGDTNAFPLENAVWYQSYLVIDGDIFTFKMKERDDPAPFHELQPVVSGQDAIIESGKIGTFGPAYYDNFVVGTIGTGPDNLQPAGFSPDKLSATWGAVKSSY